jgi:hypothetical protein
MRSSRGTGPQDNFSGPQEDKEMGKGTGDHIPQVVLDSTTRYLEFCKD